MNNDKQILKSEFPKDARVIKSMIERAKKQGDYFKITFTTFKKFLENEIQWLEFDNHIKQNITEKTMFDGKIQNQIRILFPARCTLFLYNAIVELDKNNNEVIQNYIDPLKMVNNFILGKVHEEILKVLPKYTNIQGVNVSKYMDMDQTNFMFGCNSSLVLLEKIITPIKSILSPDGTSKPTQSWKLLSTLVEHAKFIANEESGRYIEGDIEDLQKVLEDAINDYSMTNNYTIKSFTTADLISINGKKQWEIYFEDLIEKISRNDSRELKKIADKKSIPKFFKCIKKENTVYSLGLF